ncbi:HEPN domain-containing protein [Leekyejoonella antrihumi]|uniref:RiboL-PSP-HEPN domain-containing protein n=1 Tax=Leekyejoonella antrihumi TaxID=1660198 RepID=A0A563DV06_9MICO|nr:HEPN domain-containing protein [Leekyejoonella antrihumi]TWP34097.1 hypothetical protein FGL98_18480 [Leekyejoonella antrihumi]
MRQLLRSILIRSVMVSRGRAEAYKLWATLQTEYERHQEAIRAMNGSKELPLQTALKVQDDLRRYFCLRSAGFLEQVTFEVLHEYLRSKSSGPVHEFASSYFRHSPNLNAEAFVGLVTRFGTGHSERVNHFISAERKDALDTLLEVRNLVAHGLEIGGAKLSPDPHFKLCREIYDWLVEEFLDDVAAK